MADDLELVCHGCGHRRKVTTGWVDEVDDARYKSGELQARLGRLRARLRCERCGQRGPAIEGPIEAGGTPDPPTNHLEVEAAHAWRTHEHARAIQLWILAAAGGSARAHWNLALAWLRGRHTQSDPLEAARRCRIAAELDHPAALLRVARVYEDAGRPGDARRLRRRLAISASSAPRSRVSIVDSSILALIRSDEEQRSSERLEHQYADSAQRRTDQDRASPWRQLVGQPVVPPYVECPTCKGRSSLVPCDTCWGRGYILR